MTVFEARRIPLGKRQTKLYLTDEGFGMLHMASKLTGIPMSAIVERLVRDHCRIITSDEEPEERGDFDLE